MLNLLEKICQVYYVPIQYFNYKHLENHLIFDSINGELIRLSPQNETPQMLHTRLENNHEYILFPHPSIPDQVGVIGPWDSFSNNDESDAINLSEVTTWMGVINAVFQELYHDYQFKTIIAEPLKKEKASLHLEDTPSKNQEKLFQRYYLENQLMWAIETANLKYAISIHSQTRSQARNDQTIPYELTKSSGARLLFMARKAAEQGGADLHSIHKLSRYFNQKLNETDRVVELMQLGEEIIIRFCELVKNRNYASYSLIVQNCINYVLEHLTEDIRLDALAQQQYLNPSYLSKKFKQETGLTITDFINQKRLDIAKKLLRHSTKSIVQISSEAGFRDPNYFSRIFKKHCNHSPKEYRKIHSTLYK
ncbi:helix-turn-helix transcriptional regulator [Streptococcus sp. S784/96/1]|uniref:helix-turn-helix transcriptional regulator n=1 Tax=Streptococcus sp. S784/96/1 TaxID=2653499 RepID=UPI001386A3D5|nr:helix-turn-helix domain-containing protein [Streptococcus sp. S784/96/1]